MKIDPRHLEMLAAIIDAGGLTEGAARLGRTQPSVSRALAQLEHRLGLPLFMPGRRPLRPTELGAALAVEGRAVAQAGQAAAATLARHRLGRAGAIRVGGTPVMMDGVVAPMLAAFQSTEPDVRIDQSYGYVADLAGGLLADALDVGIVPLPDGQVPDGLAFEKLLAGRNVIAARRGHPLARRRTARLADVARYPWIGHPPGSPLGRDMGSALAGIGVEDVRLVHTGGSLAAIVGMLQVSDALAVLPHSVVFALRRRDALDALPIRIGETDRDLGLLTRAGPSDPPLLSRFRRHLRQGFAALAHTIQRREQEGVWRT